MTDLELFQSTVISAMKQEEIFNFQVDPSIHQRLGGGLPKNISKQTLWEHNSQVVKWVDLVMGNLCHQNYSTSPEHRQKVLFLAGALHHTCQGLEPHQTEEIKAFYQQLGEKLNFCGFWEDWRESLCDIAFLTYNSEGHSGNVVGFWGKFYQDKRELLLQTWILNYADVRAFGIDNHQLLISYRHSLIPQLKNRGVLEKGVYA